MSIRGGWGGGGWGKPSPFPSFLWVYINVTCSLVCKHTLWLGVRWEILTNDHTYMYGFFRIGNCTSCKSAVYACTLRFYEIYLTSKPSSYSLYVMLRDLHFLQFKEFHWLGLTHTWTFYIVQKYGIIFLW